MQWRLTPTSRIAFCEHTVSTYRLRNRVELTVFLVENLGNISEAYINNGRDACQLLL